MCGEITTNGVFLTGMRTVNYRDSLPCVSASLEMSASTIWHNKIGSLHFTLCTSESVLLQHVSREALTAERAQRVDTSVMADVAFIYQALIHVLHLNRTLHCILPISLLTDGEGLFRIQPVRHYSTWREWLLFSRAIQLYNDMNNCITTLK